jgi:hypothetical protein
MAIQQGLTISFKQEMLQAGQNLLTDTLKMALYTALSDVSPNTTVYTTTDEVSGTGYSAGGVVITGVTIDADVNNTVVYVNFNDVSWPGANFIARGALIYNVTKANKSVAVLDFGSDKTFNAATNTVTLPGNTSTTALLRF